MALPEFLAQFTWRNILYGIATLLVLNIGYRAITPKPKDHAKRSAHQLQTDTSDIALTTDPNLYGRDAQYRYEATYNNDTAILLCQTRYAYFTNDVQPDRFTLTLYGNSLTNARTVFTIQRSNGSTIYQDEGNTQIWAASLRPLNSPNAEVNEGDLRHEAEHFFDASAFLHPAIRATERYYDPTQHPSREAYEEFSGDDRYNGFQYLSLHERGVRIRVGFSLKRRRAEVYYRCCPI